MNRIGTVPVCLSVFFRFKKNKGGRSERMWRGIQLTKGHRAKSFIKDGRSGLYTIELGHPWKAEEFIKAAAECDHPLDRAAQLPPAVTAALQRLASRGPEQTIKHRKEVLEKWGKRRDEIEDLEKGLKARLHPEVRTVVEQKKILLFKEMLSEIEYDDMGVVELLTMGVKITGELKRIGIWKPDPSKAPKLSQRSLWMGAKKAQEEVCKKDPGDRWDKDDAELWEETTEEAKSGFLRGPFSRKELEEKIGKFWVPARRFAVRQGEKLRPIDDFSEHGVNAAFGSQERVQMKSIDQIISWSRAWLESANEEREVEIWDTAGRDWRTKLHDEWSLEEWRELRGRVADLKSAYKQLASHPAHSATAVVAVKAPDGERKLFRSLSLMFGQAAAVYAFLRFSRAIAALATELLDLIVVEFFDDFSQIEPERTASSAQEAMEKLVKLLGWRLSETEEKRKPFQKEFVALGVLFDFSRAQEKVVQLKNKPGRVDNIAEQVEAVLADPERRLQFKEALSLRGKIGFAEGQTYCRMTAYVARMLSERAREVRPRLVPEELRYGLRFAVEHLKAAAPRVLYPKKSSLPVMVYTDGACEDTTSIGGVLFVPGQRPQAFGCELSDADVAKWKSKATQKQVIGQAEIFPVLVAKLTWAEELKNKRVIFFLDNESAKIALIRAYSPVLSSLKMVMESAAWDFHNNCGTWYSRVPTACNVADDPSRMVVGELLKALNAKIVEPVLPDKMKPARWL